MAEVDKTLNDVANQLNANNTVLTNFVNGSETSSQTVAGGNLPSLKKVAKDSADEILNLSTTQIVDEIIETFSTTPLAVIQGGTGQSDVSYLRAEDSGTTSLTANVFTKINLTAVTDTKTAFSSNNWTCPATGYYQLVGSVRFGVPTTNTCVRMLKFDTASSPSSTAVLGQTAFVSAGFSDSLIQVSALLFISAGTVLSLYAYHTDTASLNVSQKSLQIIRVR